MAAKIINIEFEGTRYTLEFTRRSVEQLTRQGFDPHSLATAPILAIPQLVRGAFLAHHRQTTKETIDRIYASIPEKDKFIDALAEMYTEPVEALFDEPRETEGNATWEANW